MDKTVSLHAVARLPVATDNCAIAIKKLEPGTQINTEERSFTLSHGVLLGHRFAVEPIAEGETLYSWGQTFGIATKDIQPGDYVCNDTVLNELTRRDLDFALPEEANFRNDIAQYTFDEVNFAPPAPLPLHQDMRTFQGYRREGQRGVGTRNTIILMGTTSLTSGFVRALEKRLQSQLSEYPNVDGIVAIAHTEGGHQQPNNTDLLLRTLAGFMVHPNVGAVLAVDSEYGAINNAMLQTYAEENDYPLEQVIHGFMRQSAAFDEALAQAEEIIAGWLPQVNVIPRTAEPVSELKIALQCGGSDAFSGISGNPLAAWVAKEVIQYGGAANLAETDELIGAETYVLDKVHDPATAKKFLSFVERFKERVGWHGHSAEGNPSGGNKYRGLYNIYLKSLGAATKRHPDVPLDAVIDYAEPMQQPGYYFMDSPGNDLESVAGQVSSGCNMIFFVTGNGSITNFPFVPTIKIVTTTERYELLSNEMDINAGLYLDGMPLDELGAQTLEYTLDVASGALSVGEKAGHSQVQIWRDWPLTQAVDPMAVRDETFSGKPLEIDTDVPVPDMTIPVFENGDQLATEQIGLILPTSLCSGQIAKMATDHLNEAKLGQAKGISRFVTLVHTEGCGSSLNPEFGETLLGYLAHPFVKHALLLEHGCEMTHNDYFRNAIRQRGLNPDDFGWASIQADGGIQRVLHKITHWFQRQIAEAHSPMETRAGLEAVQLALISQQPMSAEVSSAFAHLTQMIVAGGGSVILSEQDVLTNPSFMEKLVTVEDIKPTLAYAQAPAEQGLHIMAMPTRDWGEVVTGLGTAGVNIMLAHVDEQTMPGHPMIPLLQVSTNLQLAAGVDLLLGGAADQWSNMLMATIWDTLLGHYSTKSMATENINFQVTRGLLGVSL